MADLMFRGLIPAFPTPLNADGSLDEVGLERIVDYQIERGASGLVPLGGTGEATAFGSAQRKRIMEITVSAVGKRVPVIAGVLDPGFGGAVESGKLYREAGADGLMVIPPYYTRADQEGVLRYFRALAPQLKLPILYYDNPYRCHLVTAPATIARMEEEKLIVGMKASNTDLYHLDQVSKLVSNAFCLLSGQDTLFVQQVILGAKGGVLTSAALLPDYWAKVQLLAESGRVAEALAAQGRLNPFMDALFAEQFPEAVRRAFAAIGLPVGGSLPPIGALSEAAGKRLDLAVQDLLGAGILRPVAVTAPHRHLVAQSG
jgi:4-hydroxy-tetrahydrodipicolinate synthase